MAAGWCELLAVDSGKSGAVKMLPEVWVVTRSWEASSRLVACDRTGGRRRFLEGEEEALGERERRLVVVEALVPEDICCG